MARPMANMPKIDAASSAPRPHLRSRKCPAPGTSPRSEEDKRTLAVNPFEPPRSCPVLWPFLFDYTALGLGSGISHPEEHRSLAGDPGREMPLEGSGFGLQQLWNLYNRKYRFARATSLKICSLSASGEGHFTSGRSRARNSSSIGVPSFRSSSVGWPTGSKSRMCDSTANDAAPNVGRLPTFVTALKQRPPTVSRVT